jgi:hypothetical protein
MKEAIVNPLESDAKAHVLLDTVVSAHYLALQMRILTRGEKFHGREATEFLADALSKWARIVEDDVFGALEAPAPRAPSKDH